MKKLIQYKGKAEHLRHTISSSNETLTHVALFTLDNQKVMLKMAEPIFLDYGDEIIVIGWAKDNLLHGIAYCNLSKKIAVKVSSGLLFHLVMILFLVIGLFTVTLGLGVIFLGVSFYLFYTLKCHRRANEMIDALINTYDIGKNED